MFETVTVPSPWQVPAARRTQIVGGALALHAGIAATYLAVTLWTIRPVAPPELVEAFWLEPAPPTVTFEQPRREPAAPPARPEKETPATPAAEAAPRLMQPTSVAELETATGADERLESIAATAGPVGTPIDGAVGDGSGVAISVAGDGEAAIPYRSDMAPPVVLFRTTPVYPEMARRLHKQGVVVIEAEIGRDGTLRSARAVNAPLGFGFEEAALAAFSNWRFAPARVGDRAVSVIYRLNVTFTLQ